MARDRTVLAEDNEMFYEFGGLTRTYKPAYYKLDNQWWVDLYIGTDPKDVQYAHIPFPPGYVPRRYMQ